MELPEVIIGFAVLCIAARMIFLSPPEKTKEQKEAREKADYYGLFH